jgi:hypothetical protein
MGKVAEDSEQRALTLRVPVLGFPALFLTGLIARWDRHDDAVIQKYVGYICPGNAVIGNRMSAPELLGHTLLLFRDCQPSAMCRPRQDLQGSRVGH